MRPLFNQTRLLVAGLVFATLSLLLDGPLHNWLTKSYVDQKLYKAQADLYKKERLAEDFLTSIEKQPLRVLLSKQRDILRICYQKGFSFYVFRNNGLVFWSSNSTFPERALPGPQHHLQRLSNGYYLQANRQYRDLSYVVLIPVHYQYALENQYLRNGLALGDAADLNLRLVENDPKQGYAFRSTDGRYLFSVQAETRPESFYWLAWTFIIGLFFCFLSIHSQMLKLLRMRSQGWAIALYLAGLAGYVIIWKVLRIPRALFTWPGFSAEYYGSSYLFSSLGDLFLFTLGLCYTTWFVLRLRRPRLDRLAPQWLQLGFGMMGLSIFTAYTVHLVRGLVLDSQISFDLSNIFSLNAYSIIGLLIITGWMACGLGLAQRLARRLAAEYRHADAAMLLLSCGLLASTLILMPLRMDYWFVSGYSFALCAGLYLLYRYRGSPLPKVMFYAFFLPLSALFVSIVLSRNLARNELEEQRVAASRLVQERDAIGEFLFTSRLDNLKDDPYLKTYFTTPLGNELILEKRIKQMYFSGHFSRYDLEVSTFNAQGYPFRLDFDKPLNFYLDLLRRDARPIIPGLLYFINAYNGLPSYVATVAIKRDGHVVGTVLLQLRKKGFYAESVYPELLLSPELQRDEHESPFANAVYSNGLLLSQKGSYPYPSAWDFEVPLDSNRYAFLAEGGYNHVLHQLSSNVSVVVSAPQKGAFYYISIFAFLLFFFTLVWGTVEALPWLLRKLQRYVPRRLRWREVRVWSRLSFRSKILATVLAGMTLSMLLIGFTTVQYFISQYNRDEIAGLQRRAQAITSKLDSELQDNTERLSPVSEDELSGLVKELSDVFQSDINIFDIEGNLVVSTQSIIYERQIIAPKLDARAFLKFSTRLASQIIQEERIGRLQYTAAYMPLRNAAGQIAGYLHLPYFSKEKELHDRISSFLVALVNLYLLLFLVLVALGVFMTRALTQPLDIIRDHLRKTTISGTNALISWHTEDEIGKLVNEYNQMILALKENVDKLARSEREGAWREMAKQVAHEIKNPLTPMKLNIQRLQMAYRDGSPNVPQLFEKVTGMLITQIDNLSEIATAFSNFAQMPQGQPRDMELNTLLEELHSLFISDSHAELRLELSEEPLHVHADPHQLMRVFTNLLKNAIQAIPEDKQGVVILRSFRQGDKAVVEVEDNGTGIPEELRYSIFVPSFSTKSSGMGLGLAIVKAIIERHEGRISFRTREGEGTVFRVELPMVVENE